jgi:translation initiation factor 2 beta subunit (eIF-2beta)/eIF-5
MMISLEKPEQFSIFCKNCGSYEVELWLDVDDAIVLDCQKCDIEEEI